jgi:hypothetical protein
MWEFGAASPAAVIDGGEGIEEVNAFADGDHGGEDAGEDGGVFGIESLVVGHEEGASIEEESADATASSYEAHGIGAVSVFGTSLSEVFGAFLDMDESIVWSDIEAGGFEASAAFAGILFEDWREGFAEFAEVSDV